MSDYSKSLIYKIVCKDSSITELYIGSTTNLYQRIATHKSNCVLLDNEHYNIKVYKFIRDHGGWDNWEVIELYKYPCNSKKELTVEERRAYDSYNSHLNHQKPNRTKAEYYTDHFDDRREYLNKKSKEWHQNNLEKARQSARDSAEANREKNLTPEKCECGLMITHGNMLKHKGRERHKKRMTALAAGIEIDDTPKCKKKTECECGAVVVNINRHKKESCPLRHSSA